MEPDFDPTARPLPGFNFPVLPIVTPDPPRLSTSEKYGGLFYLGVIGLVVIVSLVAWFLRGAWTLRSVWRNVYVLHDRDRSEAERVQAAFELSRDPNVNPRQHWDMCLRKPLPDLARYLLAEALPAEAAASDPRGYALTVARSPDWPDWLRLLLTRPLAYAAARGEFVSAPIVRELERRDDPAVRLWAEFALAAATPPDPAAAAALERAAETDGPFRAEAQKLLEALRSEGTERTGRLDEATLWLRMNHPAAAKVWAGWHVEQGQLVRRDGG